MECKTYLIISRDDAEISRYDIGKWGADMRSSIEELFDNTDDPFTATYTQIFEDSSTVNLFEIKYIEPGRVSVVVPAAVDMGFPEEAKICNDCNLSDAIYKMSVVLMAFYNDIPQQVALVLAGARWID